MAVLARGCGRTDPAVAERRHAQGVAVAPPSSDGGDGSTRVAISPPRRTDPDARSGAGDSAGPPGAPRWVHLYVPGWSLGARAETLVRVPSNVDLVAFSVLPTRSGSLDRKTNGLTDVRVAELMMHARAQGWRVHVAAGGERTAASFRAVVDEDGGRAFARAFAAYARSIGAIGLVLDPEPLRDLPIAATHLLIESLAAAAGEAPRLELGIDIAPGIPSTRRRSPESLRGSITWRS